MTYSFRKMFFIGQDLKHVHMIYYFLEKDYVTGVFLWVLRNFLEHHFLQSTFCDYFCSSGSCFCIFLKKVLFNSYFATLLWRWIIFSFPHIVWCVKSRTRLLINLSSIVRFSNWVMCHIKLKIGVIDHMNNIFETPFSRYLSMCL